jgi:hypothetical protein
MIFSKWLRQWQDARKEQRASKLTAKAADIVDSGQYDIIFLHQRGLIRARGNGQSITRVHVNVENLILKRLRILVTPGTYFVSSGNHQNMATTNQYEFALNPCSTEAFDVNAVCINADRPIPGERDRFVGVSRVPNDVARFLQASKNEDPMVIQAGVWTLTDKYTRTRVINHLISKDRDGNTIYPVTHDHCDRAKAILGRLGISHLL